MGPEEPWSGSDRPPGLLGSIRHFGATIVALLVTRIELVSTEVEEELQRGVIILLWMMLALLFGGLAILMLAVTLLIIFWEDHRVVIAVLITVAFIITAGVMAYLAQARIAGKPRFMAATIEELKRDRAHLGHKR
jgi:uncharacterized membrane protein YqjE